MSDMDDMDGMTGLTRSAHTASIFSSEAEQMSSAVPFMLAGLDRGDKCVYILDRNSRDDILDAMMKVRDVQPEMDSGQLAFLSVDDTYLAGGRFDTDRMVGSIREFERGSLSEGYSGLTITGEMTWCSADTPGGDRLSEYEARINGLYPESRASILCQYDEPSFEYDILLDVIRTHPRIIIGGETCANPHYLPMEEFLSVRDGSVTKEIYERTSRDILKRVRLSTIHRLELRDFRRARRKLSIIESAGLDEIDNLVSVIDFYNELAMDASRDDIARDYMREVAEKCAAMRKRIRFAKTYGLIGETEIGWCSLDSVLECASTEFVDGTVTLDGRAAGVQILADDLFPHAVRAILENVPDIGTGSDRLRLSCHEAEDDLVLTIEHSGSGVPDGVKAHLFDLCRPYRRSDGFGLFLAREILTRLGMSLRECGEAGKGTRFEVRVPAGRHRSGGVL